jgi:hypothetical protein
MSPAASAAVAAIAGTAGGSSKDRSGRQLKKQLIV